MAATTVDNRRETVSLIGSDKVEGTPVYGRDDNKIGTVQRVMLDKGSAARPLTQSYRLAASSAWARSTSQCHGRA